MACSRGLRLISQVPWSKGTLAAVDPRQAVAQISVQPLRIRPRLEIGQYRHAGFSWQRLQRPDRRFAEILRAVALLGVVPACMIGCQAGGEALIDHLLQSR